MNREAEKRRINLVNPDARDRSMFHMMGLIHRHAQQVVCTPSSRQ